MSYDQYQTDPSSMKSGQGDLLEDLLWSRLSRFWRDNYRLEDKEALNAMYEAFGKVLDAEYVKLADIQDAKSIDTCPVFTQRRWLRLDLNKYNDVKGFLRYLVSGEAEGRACARKSSEVLACSNVAENHPRHWHISFPFTVTTRTWVDLGYPLSPELVDVYRFSPLEPSKGLRLSAASDYTVEGSVIAFSGAVPGDYYEIRAGLNVTSTDYTGFYPNVVKADFAGPGSIQIPRSLSAGFPICALVVRNGASDITVSGAFTETTEFHPPANEATGQPGVSHGLPGFAQLPISDLSPLDSVYVFGLDTGRIDAWHEHVDFSTALPASEDGETIALTTPTIAAGVFGFTGRLGHVFNVFYNGNKVRLSDFIYNSAANTITFRTAKPGGQLTIESTREQDREGLETHVHSFCYGSVLESEEFARFDDGDPQSLFDEDPLLGGAPGFFDAKAPSRSVTLSDKNIDTDALRIFLDGVRQDESTWATSVVDAGIKITFSQGVAGAGVLATFERPSSARVFGTSDILIGLGDCVGNLRLSDITVGDPSIAVAAYAQKYSLSVDPRVLIDAARISAAGGNPLFALFADEYPEYTKFPIDAQDQAISSTTARNVESTGTRLVDIPFLVDFPYRPTVRLDAGDAYTVRDGEIWATQDLLSKRGAFDDQPGVWWAPLVLLDERLLAKNFGVLVGDEQDSTEQYRNEIIANLRLRFGGPTRQNLEWAAASLAGSPAFSRSSRISSVDSVTVGFDVRYQNGSRTETVRIPGDVYLGKVGDQVFGGGSASVPSPIVRTLGEARLINNRVVELDGSARVAAGDYLYYETSGGWARAIVKQSLVQVNPSSNDVVTTITLDRNAKPITGSVRVTRPGPAPYYAFDGVVTSIGRVTASRITTEAGEVYVLPEGEKTAYRGGDLVERGQPVRPQLATYYDDSTRPRWHVSQPTSSTSSSFDSSLTPGTAGYAKLALPRQVRVTRGAKVTFNGSPYTIVGLATGGAWVTPNVAERVEGTAEIIQSSPYFEYFVGVIAQPYVSRQIATGETIPVNTQGLPSRGRGIIVHDVAPGAVADQPLAFTYEGHTSHELLGVQWPGLNGTRQLLTSYKVIITHKRESQRANPAFDALLTERVVSDDGATDTARDGDEYRDSLYELFKRNSAVLEVHASVSPSRLYTLIEDCAPPWASVVILPRHEIAETYELRLNDA